MSVNGKSATADLAAKAEYEASQKAKSGTTSGPSDVDAALEQQLGVPVTEASAEQIQSAWTEVYGADAFLTESQYKVTNPKIVEALAPKPTWMTKEDQKLSYQDRAIVYGYQNVLGREVDAEGLANYRMADLTPQQIAASLANSKEAYDAGVDASKYGVQNVDPNSLGAVDKAYYDIWKQYNSKPLTNLDVQQFGYERDAGTIDAFAAKQSGAIMSKGQYDEKTGSVYSLTYVTPKAIEMMGGQIQLRGNQAGRYVVAPVGSEWAWGHENWRKVGSESDGFAMYGSVGNPTGSGFSLVGDVLGEDFEEAVNKLVPNEVKFAMDPLGIQNSALLGKDWDSDARKSTAKMFGLKEEDVALAQGIAKSAIEAVAMFTPLGVPVVAAMEFSNAVNQAAQGNVKFGKAMGTAALSTVSAMAGKYANPAVAWGVNAGATSLLGGDSEAVMDSLLWSAAGHFIPGGVATLARPLVDDEFTWEQALLQWGVNAGSQYAGTKGAVTPLSQLKSPIASVKQSAASLKSPVLRTGQMKADWRSVTGANWANGVSAPLVPAGTTPMYYV